MNIASREIRLASRPTGTPTRETFELAEVKLSTLSDGHVRVRNLWMSVNPWHYGRLPAAMDPRERAVIHCVRNEAELRWVLQGATDSTKLHLIEIILPRMDAPDPLVRFAKRAAEFDFPQLLEEEIDQVS